MAYCGFHAMDSGPQALAFGFPVSEGWISDSNAGVSGIPDALSCNAQAYKA